MAKTWTEDQSDSTYQQVANQAAVDSEEVAVVTEEEAEASAEEDSVETEAAEVAEVSVAVTEVAEDSAEEEVSPETDVAAEARLAVIEIESGENDPYVVCPDEYSYIKQSLFYFYLPFLHVLRMTHPRLLNKWVQRLLVQLMV